MVRLTGKKGNFIAKCFYIRPDQDKAIKKLVKPGHNQSDIIRDALDEYFSKRKRKYEVKK